MVNPPRISIRLALPDDDAIVAEVITNAFAGDDDLFDPREWMAVERVRTHLQTGSTFFLAERSGELLGAVRAWDRDGIAWFSALASERPPAGRELVRGVERFAQDAGLRLVRFECPDELGLDPLFSRWGYRPVAREQRPAGTEGITKPWTAVTYEKRVRLLTCRPGRRGDEEALLALGFDVAPQSVTAAVDGDAIVGAIRLQRRNSYEAELSAPSLAEGYEHRGIDLFMATVAARSAAIDGLARLYASKSDWPEELGARGWQDEGAWWSRDLGDVVTLD